VAYRIGRYSDRAHDYRFLSFVVGLHPSSERRRDKVVLISFPRRNKI
jgi:hypothetical protein